MMRLGVTAAMAILIGSSVLSAQEPSVPQDQKAPAQGEPAPIDAPRPATSAARPAPGQTPSVTVVGCLQPVEQAAGAANGAAAKAAPTFPTFLLTNANIGSGPAAGASASTVGVSGSGGPPSYVLEGSDLTEHIGQQVEVTGTMIPAKATGRPARGAAATAGSAADTPRATGTAGTQAATDQNAALHVRVSAVRMVSEMCK